MYLVLGNRLSRSLHFTIEQLEGPIQDVKSQNSKLGSAFSFFPACLRPPLGREAAAGRVGREWNFSSVPAHHLHWLGAILPQPPLAPGEGGEARRQISSNLVAPLPFLGLIFRCLELGPWMGMEDE